MKKIKKRSKKNTYTFLGALICLTMLLSGCGDKSNDKKEVQKDSDKVIEVSGSNKKSDNIKTELELNHTYTTRFGEENMISYPAFSFDYSDGWTVTEEEVSATSEKVVLTNENGTNITYWNFGDMRELTGPIRVMNEVTVTKESDASFIPGYVQATDYSSLGKFVVAEIKITGECDMLGDGEMVKVENGNIRYALVPESEIGEQEECVIAGLPTFSFWYGGHISLLATTPNESFTEQEKKEVTAILASFRNESSKQQASNGTATIEDVWEELKGEWISEDYTFKGETEEWKEHIIEFSYKDDIPCMTDTFTRTNSEKKILFYEFDIENNVCYNAYTYKNGSYDGNESANWSDDVKLVWYSFDLSNISEGELLVVQNIEMVSGHVDEHQFTYHRKK